MKTLAPILVITMAITASAAWADLPVIGRGPIGSPNPLPPSRDTCWSEPPDLNGQIGSSEQMLMYGLESEIANDFVVSGSVITKASWAWAWYDEYACGSHPSTPGFNLRFYEDTGCMPGSIIADLSITGFEEEYLGCFETVGIDDLFRATTDISVNVVPGQTYWCGVQVKDHTFPPQAGRLAASVVTDCESMFKSAYFGFPNWTRTRDVWGFSWDASQEFWCGVTPVQGTSWSRIRALFR
jgi:hypothetical protein